jgi:sulfatase modifying factor 1
MMTILAVLGGAASDVESDPRIETHADRVRLRPHPDAAIVAGHNAPHRVILEEIGLTLRLVSAADFVMGSPESEPGRSKSERSHRRRVLEGFYLGETEVTVGQFRAFVESTGYVTGAERGLSTGEDGAGSFAATSDGNREWSAAANWRNPFPNFPDVPADDRHPVVHVSWNDARAFADHYGLRLPTESEWELAARGGRGARFPWGDSLALGGRFANGADRSAAARFSSMNQVNPFDDGFVFLAPVGRFEATSPGFLDLAGNVAEWCEDVYGPYPADGAFAGAADGPPEAPRVVRGGSWVDGPDHLRSAARAAMAPTDRRDFTGFRVAIDVHHVARPGDDLRRASESPRR